MQIPAGSTAMLLCPAVLLQLHMQELYCCQIQSLAMLLDESHRTSAVAAAAVATPQVQVEVRYL